MKSKVDPQSIRADTCVPLMMSGTVISLKCFHLSDRWPVKETYPLQNAGKHLGAIVVRSDSMFNCSSERDPKVSFK